MGKINRVERVILPPLTGFQPEAADFVQQVATALNDLPTISLFSAANPNSLVTATGPAIAINYSSSGSGLWFMGAASGTTDQGWTAVA